MKSEPILCSKGVWIPNEVLGNQDLTNFEKLLFPIIETLDNEKGCSVSNQCLATLLNVTTATVSMAINNLIRYEYLTRIAFDGRQRIIKVNLSYKKKYSKLANFLASM